MEIVHRPGSTMFDADALSRLPPRAPPEGRAVSVKEAAKDSAAAMVVTEGCSERSAHSLEYLWKDLGKAQEKVREAKKQIGVQKAPELEYLWEELVKAQEQVKAAKRQAGSLMARKSEDQRAGSQVREELEQLRRSITEIRKKRDHLADLHRQRLNDVPRLAPRKVTKAKEEAEGRTAHPGLRKIQLEIDKVTAQIGGIRHYIKYLKKEQRDWSQWATLLQERRQARRDMRERGKVQKRSD